MQQPLTMSTVLDPRRVDWLDRDGVALEEAREAGAVEEAAVGHHASRLVHEADDRAEDAMIGMMPGRGQQAVDEVGGNDRVVVEQEDLLGPALEGVADAGVVPAGPAAVILAADDRHPRMGRAS